MKTPEQFLREVIKYFPDDYVLDTPDEGISIHMLIRAMEEYKNQFIDFDGPMAMIDHQQRLLGQKDQTIGRLENDLSDGVKILETIWIAFDRDYLMKSLLSADYENLKNYLGK